MNIYSVRFNELGGTSPNLNTTDILLKPEKANINPDKGYVVHFQIDSFPPRRMLLDIERILQKDRGLEFGAWVLRQWMLSFPSFSPRFPLLVVHSVLVYASPFRRIGEERFEPCIFVSIRRESTWQECC